MLDNRNQIILGNQARDNLIMFKLNSEVGASLSVTRSTSSGDYLLNLISKDGTVINSVVLPTSGGGGGGGGGATLISATLNYQNATITLVNSDSTRVICDISEMVNIINNTSSGLSTHLVANNPHNITAETVGLGNVTNESKETMFTSPTFTGTPTAPALTTGSLVSQVATKGYVDDQNLLKQNTITTTNKLSSDLVTDTNNANKFVTSSEKSTWSNKQDAINVNNKISSDFVNDTGATNKFVTTSEKTTWNGKQDGITSSNKLSSDLVDDTNANNLFVSSTEKSTWNGKQNAIDSSHKLTSDLVDDTSQTNLFVTSSEKSTWNGKQDTIDSSHKLSSDLVDDTGATNLFVTSGEKSTWSGKQDALTASVGIDITSNTIKTTGVEYVSGSTTQSQPLKFVYMDETSYANMGSHDSNTLYLLYATTP